jgi:hypothetical protein
MKLNSIAFTAFLCCLSAIATAQTDEASIKRKMWGEKFTPPDASVKEKYKDESAVILLKNEIFEYSRKLGAKVNNDNYLRMRVLLLDAAAVEEYSELSFTKLGLSSYKREGTFIGVKVVKPDGKEREVRLDEAVKMRMFRDAAETRETKDSYQKVAIDNLEQGDVIDFYIANVSRVNVTNYNYGSYFVFDPEIIIFKSYYPVLDGRVSFLAEKNCYINLSLPDGYDDPKVKEADNKVYYELKYASDEKLKEIQWDAPLVTEPVLKFQVVAATIHGSEVYKHMIGKIGKPKLKTVPDDHEKLLNYLAMHAGNATMLQKESLKFIGKQRHIKAPETIARDLFYFARHHLFFDYFLVGSAKYYNYQLYDEFDVIRSLSFVLKKLKIEHEVFIGVSKQNGSIDKTLLFDEVTPGIKVKTADGPVYFYTPGVHSLFGEPSYGLQGTKIYTTRVGSAYPKKVALKQEVIPAGNPSDNMQFDSLFVKITAGEEQVQINRTIHTTGGMQDMFNSMSRMQFQYFRDESTAINTIGKLSKLQQFHQDYLIEIVDKEKEGELKAGKEIVKLWLEDINGISDPQDLTVNVLSVGRSRENPALRFTMNFSADDILAEAGGHLVVDMVKLFGKFAEFSEKEKERNADIYMPCPRVLKWYIALDIPEGYSVSNAEVFNGSLANSAGSFECNTSVQDGKLIVEAAKTYNHDYEPLSKWPELLAMLEYSHTLSQQKLVLSKTGN